MCMHCWVKGCVCFYCVCCSTGKGEDGELTSGRQLVAFCGVGNKRGCHGMELHIMTDGESDKQAREERKHQQAADHKRAGKRKKQ